MMFRAAKPLLFVGTASASGAVIAARSSRLQCDEGNPLPPRREKLSIYPKADPEVILVETHTPLEKHIGIAREAVTSAYLDGESRVKAAVDRWIGLEHAVEKQIKQIIPPDEPMTPGLLYVGVATLTGSVIGRTRRLPIRLLLPPTLLVASLGYFLPKTSSNLSAYYAGLERSYAPGFADKRTEWSKDAARTLKGLSRNYQNAKVSVIDKVRWARSEVEDKTGLKVGDLEGSKTRVQALAQGTGASVAEKAPEAEQQGEGLLEEEKPRVVEEEPKRLV